MDEEEIKTATLPSVSEIEAQISLISRELEALQKDMLESLEAKRIEQITQTLKS